MAYRLCRIRLRGTIDSRTSAEAAYDDRAAAHSCSRCEYASAAKVARFEQEAKPWTRVSNGRANIQYPGRLRPGGVAPVGTSIAIGSLRSCADTAPVPHGDVRPAAAAIDSSRVSRKLRSPTKLTIQVALRPQRSTFQPATRTTGCTLMAIAAC